MRLSYFANAGQTVFGQYFPDNGEFYKQTLHIMVGAWIGPESEWGHKDYGDQVIPFIEGNGARKYYQLTDDKNYTQSYALILAPPRVSGLTANAVVHEMDCHIIPFAKMVHQGNIKGFLKTNDNLTIWGHWMFKKNNNYYENYLKKLIDERFPKYKSKM